MKLDVIDLDALVSWLARGNCTLGATLGSISHQELVVDSKLALWHTCEESLDTDTAVHVSLQNSAS